MSLDDHGFEVSRETWEELMGVGNWEGLLEPLDMNLRKFILRCGDFCQSAYDAFTGTSPSRNVRLPPGNSWRYDVHSSFYATPVLNWVEKLIAIPTDPVADHEPNWMGFCASTSDEASRISGRREIYIAWRGTQKVLEWWNNLKFKYVDAECLLRDSPKEKKKPMITDGWLSIYTSYKSSSRAPKSAREQIWVEIGRVLEKYRGEKVNIIVTGHSLGGILAILSAFDLVENLVSIDIMVTAVIFGCPLVGNEAFKARVEQHCNLKILQVRNDRDFIPRFPLRKVRVGRDLVINTAKSPIKDISESWNPGLVHDLEATLHIISGWTKSDENFVACVNRSTDRLLMNAKAFEYMRSEIESWILRLIKIMFFKIYLRAM